MKSMTYWIHLTTVEHAFGGHRFRQVPQQHDTLHLDARTCYCGTNPLALMIPSQVWV